MAQQVYSNSEVFLRQMIETEVPQQYQDEARFLNELVEKKPGKWVNQKGLQITSDFAPDSSVTNVSAGGAFPGGGINAYANMYVGYVRQVGTIEFDLDTYDDMSKGKESALVSVAEKIKRVNAAQFREQEEQCWQDGTGVKAVVASASGSTYTLTTTETTAVMTSKGAQFLYPNRRYDRYSASGTLLHSNNLSVTITKQGTSPTALMADAVVGSVTAGDVLVHTGGYNKAARGIPYLLGNGSGLKQGLLQSAYPELKSPLEDLNGAVLQPSTILRLLNKIKYRRGVSAGKGLLIAGSVAMVEAYNRSGFNFIQLGMGQTYDGIVSNSTAGGNKLMEITTCDEGTLTILDPSTIFRIEKMPYGFIREGDGLTFRQKQGSNGTGAMAIYANVGVEWNLYTTVPGAGGRIIRGSVSGLSTEATAWAA